MPSSIPLVSVGGFRDPTLGAQRGINALTDSALAFDKRQKDSAQQRLGLAQEFDIANTLQGVNKGEEVQEYVNTAYTDLANNFTKSSQDNDEIIHDLQSQSTQYDAQGKPLEDPKLAYALNRRTELKTAYNDKLTGLNESLQSQYQVNPNTLDEVINPDRVQQDVYTDLTRKGIAPERATQIAEAEGKAYKGPDVDYKLVDLLQKEKDRLQKNAVKETLTDSRSNKQYKDAIYDADGNQIGTRSSGSKGKGNKFNKKLPISDQIFEHSGIKKIKGAQGITEPYDLTKTDSLESLKAKTAEFKASNPGLSDKDVYYAFMNATEGTGVQGGNKQIDLGRAQHYVDTGGWEARDNGVYSSNKQTQTKAPTTLKTISDVEGTTDAQAKKSGFASGYDVPFGYKKYAQPNKPLSTMTLDEVAAYQEKLLASTRADGNNTSAVGRYQFTRATLKEFAKKAGATGSSKFDAALQDKMATLLFNERGETPWEGFTKNRGAATNTTGKPDLGQTLTTKQTRNKFTPAQAAKDKQLTDRLNKALGAGNTKSIVDVLGGDFLNKSNVQFDEGLGKYVAPKATTTPKPKTTTKQPTKLFGEKKTRDLKEVVKPKPQTLKEAVTPKKTTKTPNIKDAIKIKPFTKKEAEAFGKEEGLGASPVLEILPLGKSVKAAKDTYKAGQTLLAALKGKKVLKIRKANGKLLQKTRKGDIEAYIDTITNKIKNSRDTMSSTQFAELTKKLRAAKTRLKGGKPTGGGGSSLDKVLNRARQSELKSARTK